MARPRISVSGLMFLVLALAIGFIAVRLASRAWAGVVLFLTLSALLTAIVGAIYRTESRRAFWLGFSLFGWGYMLATASVWFSEDGPDLITTMLLESHGPLHQHAGELETVLTQLRTGHSAKDQKILEKLEMKIPLPFPDETPLEDILKYIKAATQGPNDGGIPIYVEPEPIEGEVERIPVMQVPITIDVEGLPLRTTLPLVLQQANRAYVVREGLLMITARSLAYNNADALTRIGHCYVALLMGWIGGLIARGFYATREPRPNPSREPGAEMVS